jgi:hypothetical protein
MSNQKDEVETIIQELNKVLFKEGEGETVEDDSITKQGKILATRVQKFIELTRSLKTLLIENVNAPKATKRKLLQENSKVVLFISNEMKDLKEVLLESPTQEKKITSTVKTEAVDKKNERKKPVNRNDANCEYSCRRRVKVKTKSEKPELDQVYKININEFSIHIKSFGVGFCDKNKTLSRLAILKRLIV